MSFRLFSFKKMFETKPISVENAVSRQIYNRSMSQNELIETFKSDIYSRISSTSFYGSEVHFIAVPYPYFLSSDEINTIMNELRSEGYRVQLDSSLGFFVVSWNHLYHE